MKIRRTSAYFSGVWRPLCGLLLGGFLAGFCNGLLGAGGGIILVLVFSRLFGSDTEARRSIYANALLVMLPLSCLTLFRYLSSDALTDKLTSSSGNSIVLGAILGGFLGGVVLGRLRGSRLKFLFAALTVLSGIIMLTR